MKKLLTIVVLAALLCMVGSAALADTKYEFDAAALFTAPTVAADGTATFDVNAGVTVKVDGVDFTTKGQAAVQLKAADHGKAVLIQVDFTDGSHKIISYNVWPHKFSTKGEVTTPATCTEKGVKTFKCTVKGCTETKTEEVEPTHTWIEEIKEPNCGKDGTAQQVCKICGEKGAEYVLKAAEHKWEIQVVKPVCKKGNALTDIVDGYFYYKCSVCGKYDADGTASVNDDPRVEKDKVDDAWKTSNKLTLADAVADPEKYGVTADYDGHDWDGWIYFPADCTKAGSRVHWCNRCEANVEEKAEGMSEADLKDQWGKEYEKWGAALAPDWKLVIANGNTVVDCGMKAGTDFWFECARCGGTAKDHTTKGLKAPDFDATIDDESVDAITFTVAADAKFTDLDGTQFAGVHKYEKSEKYLIKDAKGKSEIVATCTEDGYEYYKCVNEKAKVSVNVADGTVTGNTHPTLKVKTADKLGHEFSAWTMKYAPKEDQNQKGLWVRSCTRCGITQEKHGFEAPKDDCTGEHEFVLAEGEELPKCGETKKVTYKCANCDVTEEIEVTGEHEWEKKSETKAATCKEEGSALFVCKKCSVSEERPIEKLPHTWDEGKVTKEATKEAKGEKTFTCTVCGETKVEEFDYEVTADPKYTVTAEYKDGVVSGKLTHVEDTKEAEKQYVRVTFYIAGNQYMATMAEVAADGTFSVEGVGPIEYITVLPTGTSALNPESVVKIGDGIEIFVK